MKKVDKTIVMRIHWKREMKWNEINKIATYSQNIVSLLVWMIGMDLFAAQFCWIIEWVDEYFESHLILDLRLTNTKHFQRVFYLSISQIKMSNSN